MSAFPALTFSDIEAYVLKKSGCKGTERGYQYFAEYGYLHGVEGKCTNSDFEARSFTSTFNHFAVSYEDRVAQVTAKSYRSQKKNEPPHSIFLTVTPVLDSTEISGKCSCPAGIGGYCNHVIGLLYYLAHCKKMMFTSIPDEITCTSMKERWSVPRGKKIQNEEIQDVKVKKIQPEADYSRFIKSTLYSPSPQYPIFTQNDFEGLQPKPLAATIAPKDGQNFLTTSSKFGSVVIGSVLSYQQRYSEKYVINDYSHSSFPQLPLANAEDRFKNDLCTCLQREEMVAFDSLHVSMERVLELESNTRSQSESGLWQMLRKKRITASKFGSVAKRQKDFETFVEQLNRSRAKVTPDMQRGLDLENRAAYIYAHVAKQGKVNVFPSGLIINPKCPWLGCTPDRKVYCLDADKHCHSPFGLLEIKVVKAGATNFENVAYLVKDYFNHFQLKRNHDYFYQVQCQLALTGLEWCDFFSYIDDDTFFCEKITFDPEFFQKAKDKVDLFYFNYFLGH